MTSSDTVSFKYALAYIVWLVPGSVALILSGNVVVLFWAPFTINTGNWEKLKPLVVTVSW